MNKPKKLTFDEFYKANIEGEPLNYDSCKMLFHAQDEYINHLEQENAELRETIAQMVGVSANKIDGQLLKELEGRNE